MPQNFRFGWQLFSNTCIAPNTCLKTLNSVVSYFQRRVLLMYMLRYQLTLRCNWLNRWPDTVCDSSLEIDQWLHYPCAGSRSSTNNWLETEGEGQIYCEITIITNIPIASIEFGFNYHRVTTSDVLSHQMCSETLYTVKERSHVTSASAFPLIFDVAFLKMLTLSMNTVSCSHRTHSWCLTHTQTLRVNKA